MRRAQTCALHASCTTCAGSVRWEELEAVGGDEEARAEVAIEGRTREDGGTAAQRMAELVQDMYDRR